MRSRDQLKHPKVFSMLAVRNKDGSFDMLGGECKYLKRVNQYCSKWVKVDTRDLATELNNSKIRSL